VTMAEKKTLVSFTDSTQFDTTDLDLEDDEEEKFGLAVIGEETPLLPVSDYIDPVIRSSISSESTFTIEDIESVMTNLSDQSDKSPTYDSSPQRSDHWNHDNDQSFVSPRFSKIRTDYGRVSVKNIMANRNRVSSFKVTDDVYEMAPTQLKDNVKLVTDPNLYENEQGKIYYSEYSFYKNRHEPKYALTVQSSIYRQIWNEVNEAYSVPCGLYFCCHGGDGAHTGVSHGDYVDIKLAWCILIVVFGALLTVEITFPWPDVDDISDDVFSSPY